MAYHAFNLYLFPLSSKADTIIGELLYVRECHLHGRLDWKAGRVLRCRSAMITIPESVETLDK